MKELRIGYFKIAIDWHEDREPTEEEVLDIVTAANSAMFKCNGSPLLTYESHDSLQVEIVDEYEDGEL